MNATHAYLILASNLEEANINPALKSESADVSHLLAPIFGIGEARRLKELSSGRAFAGESRYFIIVTRALTHEAQNAVLKLFEEPPVGTIFYLIVPSESVLLPTLRSRLLLQDGKTHSREYAQADEFLRSSYKDRLEWIAEAAKKEPETLKELVRELGQQSNPKWQSGQRRSLLLSLRYVYNRGASKKMLLEELALSLPVEK